MLVDSHCHLDFNDFDEDFEEMLERARDNGVTAMLNAGNNIGELQHQLEISEKYPFIYTAAGVHPHNAHEYPDTTAADFVMAARHKKLSLSANAALIITTITARATSKFVFSGNK